MPFLFFYGSFEELPWHSLRIIHQGVIHEPLCSIHSRPVCHRSHRFPVPARRELAKVHVRLCPDSGEINPEVGDCEDAGTVRGAIYRCPVTGAAEAARLA
jgi:hypothetical protein